MDAEGYVQGVGREISSLWKGVLSLELKHPIVGKETQRTDGGVGEQGVMGWKEGVGS